MDGGLWKEWAIYMAKVFAVSAIALLLIFLSAALIGVRDICCGPFSDTGGIKVAASFFPVYDIAKNIAGERIDVVRILPAGASPHTFEVTPDKAKEMNGAKAVFKIGGVDDWIDAISDSVGAEKIVLRRGIDIRDYSVTSIGEGEEEGGEGDPHYWTTMKNAKVMASTIAAELSRLDPEGVGYFNDNLASFVERADAAEEEIRTILAPHSGKNIIAFHNAWSYLVDEYGLVIAASFEPAPGKEPSSSHLKALFDLVREKDIKVIFSEPSFSDASIRSFVSDLGLELYVLYPESGSSPDASYIDTMVENAKIIDRALSK